jgi:hypothetical protein
MNKNKTYIILPSSSLSLSFILSLALSPSPFFPRSLSPSFFLSLSLSLSLYLSPSLSLSFFLSLFLSLSLSFFLSLLLALSLCQTLPVRPGRSGKKFRRVSTRSGSFPIALSNAHHTTDTAILYKIRVDGGTYLKLTRCAKGHIR